MWKYRIVEEQRGFVWMIIKYHSYFLCPHFAIQIRFEMQEGYVAILVLLNLYFWVYTFNYFSNNMNIIYFSLRNPVVIFSRKKRRKEKFAAKRVRNNTSDKKDLPCPNITFVFTHRILNIFVILNQSKRIDQ